MKTKSISFTKETLSCSKRSEAFYFLGLTNKNAGIKFMHCCESTQAGKNNQVKKLKHRYRGL